MTQTQAQTQAQTASPVVDHLTTGTAEAVLVVEFRAWTTAPRLSRLLADRLPGHPVLQLDPVGALSRDRSYRPLPELAASCVEELEASGLPEGRVFVAGHCSAAALSLHVAELLGRTREVTVLLLGPSWPDQENVQHRFAEALTSLRAPARECPPLGGDPAAVVGELGRALQDELDMLAAAKGIDSAAGAFSELLGWHRGWLSFLLSCHRDPTERWATSPSTEVLVLARSQQGDHVVGMPREEYAVHVAPVLHEQDPITAELAEHVVDQVRSRAAAHRAPS